IARRSHRQGGDCLARKFPIGWRRMKFAQRRKGAKAQRKDESERTKHHDQRKFSFFAPLRLCGKEDAELRCSITFFTSWFSTTSKKKIGISSRRSTSFSTSRFAPRTRR